MLFTLFILGLLIGFGLSKLFLVKPAVELKMPQIRQAGKNKKVKPLIKDDAAAVKLEDKKIHDSN